MSLESPPNENGHSLGEIISTVLPENAEEVSDRSNAKRGPTMHSNGSAHNHNMDVFAQQNRAPGSQFRNGSITVSITHEFFPYCIPYKRAVLNKRAAASYKLAAVPYKLAVSYKCAISIKLVSWHFF